MEDEMEDDLHDVLLNKEQSPFWKTLACKFSTNIECYQLKVLCQKYDIIKFCSVTRFCKAVFCK